MYNTRKLSAPSTHLAIFGLLALGACGTPTDLPLEESNQPIVNGPVVPDFAQQGTPRLILPDGSCSTVVYNKYWVITAAHCLDLPWDANQDGVIAGSERPLTFYIDRVVIDSAGNTGQINIQAAYRHPNSAGWESTQGTDMALLKLDSNSSGVYVPYLNPVNYSNGTLKIYNGSTASLQNQYVLAFGWGHFLSAPPYGDENLHRGWKTIYKTDYTGADQGTYSAQQYNGGGTSCHGDSGGPDYLWDGTGFQMTGIHSQMWPETCKSGADHVDLNRGAEMWRDWVDNTLFGPPQALRSPAEGFAMALTATGAVTAYLSAGTVYFSQCRSEPCDTRGSWSTPSWAGSNGNAAPAITADAGGAQVFQPAPSGIWALHIADGGTVLGYSDLGGLTRSAPAASTRPNSGNLPLVEVVHTGTDANIYYNWGRNSVFHSWSSLGRPAVGLRAAASPAFVATDNNTVYLGVVGGDGNMWMRTGHGQPPSINWTSWGQVPGTIPSGLGSLQNIAMASYAPTRIDIIGTTTYGSYYGRMVHRIYDGNSWSAGWTQITPGWWSSTATPFAASYSGKLGLLTVGSIGITPNANTAFIQRYSDW